MALLYVMDTHPTITISTTPRVSTPTLLPLKLGVRTISMTCAWVCRQPVVGGSELLRKKREKMMFWSFYWPSNF